MLRLEWGSFAVEVSASENGHSDLQGVVLVPSFGLLELDFHFDDLDFGEEDLNSVDGHYEFEGTASAQQGRAGMAAGCDIGDLGNLVARHGDGWFDFEDVVSVEGTLAHAVADLEGAL